ncbi:hypothetical protein UFOVP238_49 [uncultured Caudovirales phage]|uniref:Uncharacterized protein n=1 Tax=uncultured Caudovirales phage TaxID=2100421 RepID=A0A6J7WUB4_9CAUD|nr:hypothetical protein UFOVP238_49 [uncultured Caudovirales phage]
MVTIPQRSGDQVMAVLVRSLTQQEKQERSWFEGVECHNCFRIFPAIPYVIRGYCPYCGVTARQ